MACHGLRQAPAYHDLAVSAPGGAAIWELAVTYIINDQCIDEKDGSCVNVCPVDCIYEGSRKRYIQPDECIECGACLPECPHDAIIAPDEDQPARWVEDNAAFFSLTLPGRPGPLGSPGGADPVGPAEADTPLVAGWPAADKAV